MDSRLLGLVIVFVPLSLMSFGGGQAIVADIQHQTVAVHGWLTDRQFTDLYAVSRAAPGPSTLVAALIGWQVYGFWGALIATLAVFVPASIIVYFATGWWHRNHGSPWRLALERGLQPVAVGLVFAGIAAVLQAAHIVSAQGTSLLGIATVLTSTALLTYTKISPYTLMGLVATFYGALQLV